MIYGPYPAVVADVHDGDTMKLDIDMGFGLTMHLSCRIFGINAPELSTGAGQRALAYTLTIVHVGDVVHVTSHGWDKYAGRFDGSVTLPDGSDFAQRMLDSGNAVPYP